MLCALYFWLGLGFMHLRPR